MNRPTALVTGGARRIGKALVRHLAAQGYQVAVHYHHSSREARRLIQECYQKWGVDGAAFQADLLDQDQAQGLLPQVGKRFGKIQVLVNNASVFEPSRLPQGDLQDLDRQFAVNFKAPYALSAAFAAQGVRGQIINILDTHIKRHHGGHFNYLLSKKALADLTRMAAVALAPDIRVNGIAPGLILKPSQEDSTYLDRLARGVPLKRKGRAAHIIQAIDFLLTNDYVTGQILYEDGGEHLRG